MSRLVIAVALLIAFSSTASAQTSSVCQYQCGAFVSGGPLAKPCTGGACRTVSGCFCDSACLAYGDCCVGAVDYCMGPQLSSLAPMTGPTTGGTVLTISGSHFGTTAGSVTLGSVTLPSSSWTDTRVLATTPAGQGANIPVTVITSGGQKSNSLLFAYGTTTTGSSVCKNQCGLFVSGGPVAQQCSTYVWMNSTGTGCRVAGGCYCDDLCVRYGDCCVGAVDTCLGPQLSSVTPMTGPTTGGTVLTISGTHFGTTAGSLTLGTVTFSGSYWSDTKVLAPAPAGQGANLPLSVVTAGKKSNPVSFSYSPPTIQNVSPATEVAPNTLVTLSGTNLGFAGGGVLVGRTSVPVQSQTNTAVKFVMPSGTGVTTVQYSVAGQTSNSLSIAYPKPSIAAFSPTLGPTGGGVTITMTGQNFLGDAPAVTVGAQTAQLLSATANSAAIMLPAGAGTVPVVFKAGGARLEPGQLPVRRPCRGCHLSDDPEELWRGTCNQRQELRSARDARLRLRGHAQLRDRQLQPDQHHLLHHGTPRGHFDALRCRGRTVRFGPGAGDFGIEQRPMSVVL